MKISVSIVGCWFSVMCAVVSGSSSYWSILQNITKCKYTLQPRERSGSVVECLTQDRRAAGSSLTSVTAWCPLARHINSSLVLVQPRKTHPDVTERLLTGM